MKVKKQRFNRVKLQEYFWGYLFITPIYLGFIIFLVIPLIYSISYSFTDFNVISNQKNFIGLQNFETLFNDKSFRKAVYNTVYLMMGIPIGMTLGFLLASALNSKIRFKRAYMVLYYLPAVSSALAVGIVWKWFFNADYGVINQLIGKKIYWLVDPRIVKISLIMKGLWGGLGGTMLLYLAAMQNLSPTYYEVADLEGANFFQKTFKITIPLVAPTTFYLFVTGIIGGMSAFTDNYIIVASDSSKTIVYYLWEKMKIGEYGLVSAGAILLAGVVFILTLIQFRFINRRIYGA